jgi:hypothetical protein
MARSQEHAAPCRASRRPNHNSCNLKQKRRFKFGANCARNTEQIHATWQNKDGVATLLLLYMTGSCDGVVPVWLLHNMGEKKFPEWIVKWVDSFISNITTSLCLPIYNTDLNKAQLRCLWSEYCSDGKYKGEKLDSATIGSCHCPDWLISSHQLQWEVISATYLHWKCITLITRGKL